MSAVDARRHLLPSIVAAVLGLAVGYLVYFLIEHALTAIWVDVPNLLGPQSWWFAPAVLIPAAVLVFLIRRHLGDEGHSPLGGITMSRLSPRQYGPVIAAIAVSLIGGAVLGPEVALVTTGAVVGYLVARWWRVDDDKRIILAATGGAVLALIIGPLLSGSFAVTKQPESVAVDDLLWAIPVALIVAGLVGAARAIGHLVHRWTGSGPHAPALVAAAVVISGAAIGFEAITGESFVLIPTSGAEYLSEIETLTAAGSLALLVIFKSLAYGVSLGAGFAGGPFFPAMFIGAAAGLWAAQVLPAGPHPAAAAAVGVTAAAVATARMPWVAVVALGALIGLAVGGWTVVPTGVLGAVAASSARRLVLRFATTA